jgi:hypothetical protein
MNFEEMESGLDSSGMDWEQVAGIYEKGNEIWGTNFSNAVN